MLVVIDLFGESEDVISLRPEEDPEVLAQREEQRKRFLEELFKRAPQPQVVPVER